MIGPGENWGPFHAAISHAERVARLRGLRAIVEQYHHEQSEFRRALYFAETGDTADLETALIELDRLPALTRRKVLTAYARLSTYKPKRDGNMPMQLEGAG
jgi:hypothetical protein